MSAAEELLEALAAPERVTCSSCGHSCLDYRQKGDARTCVACVAGELEEASQELVALRAEVGSEEGDEGFGAYIDHLWRKQSETDRALDEVRRELSEAHAGVDLQAGIVDDLAGELEKTRAELANVKRVARLALEDAETGLLARFAGSYRALEALVREEQTADEELAPATLEDVPRLNCFDAFIGQVVADCVHGGSGS